MFLTAILMLILYIVVICIAHIDQCFDASLDSNTPSMLKLPLLVPASNVTSDCFPISKTWRWARFSFRALSTSNYTFRTLSAVNFVDTVMEIRSGSGCGQSFLACNDDIEVTGGYSSQTLVLKENDSVIILVGAFDTALTPSETSVTLSVQQPNQIMRPSTLPTQSPFAAVRTQSPTRPVRPTRPTVRTAQPTSTLRPTPFVPEMSEDCLETNLAQEPGGRTKVPQEMTSKYSNTTTRMFVLECQENKPWIGRVFRFQAPDDLTYEFEVSYPFALDIRAGSCLNRTSFVGGAFGTCAYTKQTLRLMENAVVHILVMPVFVDEDHLAKPISFTLSVRSFTLPPGRAPPPPLPPGGSHSEMSCREEGDDVGEALLPSLDLSNLSFPVQIKSSTDALRFQSRRFPECADVRRKKPVMVFKYRAPFAGHYSFNTVLTRGAIDTMLQVTTAEYCEMLGCNDDIMRGVLQSEVIVSLQAQQMVYVFVSPFLSTDVSFILSISKPERTQSPTQSPSIAWVPDEPECRLELTPEIGLNVPLNGTTSNTRRRKLSCSTTQAGPTSVYRLMMPRNVEGMFRFIVRSEQQVLVELRQGSCKVTPDVCEQKDTDITIWLERSLQERPLFILITGSSGQAVNFTLTVLPMPPTLTPSLAPTMTCMNKLLVNVPLVRNFLARDSVTLQSLTCGRYRATTTLFFVAPRRNEYTFRVSAATILNDFAGVDTVLEVRKGVCPSFYCSDTFQDDCEQHGNTWLGCNNGGIGGMSSSSQVSVVLDKDEQVFVLVQLLHTPNSTITVTVNAGPSWLEAFQHPPVPIRVGQTLVASSANKRTVLLPISTAGMDAKAVQLYRSPVQSAPGHPTFYSLTIHSKALFDIGVTVSADDAYLPRQLLSFSGDESALTQVGFFNTNGTSFYLTVSFNTLTPVWYSLQLESSITSAPTRAITRSPTSPPDTECVLPHVDATISAGNGHVLVEFNGTESTRSFVQCVGQHIRGHFRSKIVQLLPVAKSGVYWIQLVQNEDEGETFVKVYLNWECDRNALAKCVRPYNGRLAMELTKGDSLYLIISSRTMIGTFNLSVQPVLITTDLRSELPTSVPTSSQDCEALVTPILEDGQSLPVEIQLGSSSTGVMTRPRKLLSCDPSLDEILLSRRQQVFSFTAPVTSSFEFTITGPASADTVMEILLGTYCRNQVWTGVQFESSLSEILVDCNDDAYLDVLTSRIVGVPLRKQDTVTILVHFPVSVSSPLVLNVDRIQTQSPTTQRPSTKTRTKSPKAETVVCDTVHFSRCPIFAHCKRNFRRRTCTPRVSK